MNAAGTDSGDAGASGPVFSPDGTKVAFISGSSNLGPTDSNGLNDVYVRDLATGVTSLVSANASGTGSGNGVSNAPTFSPDGTKIAFGSNAGNLGPADSDVPSDVLSSDIYVRDLTTNTTTLVSHNPAGTDSAPGPSGGPVFSPDGTKVLFNNFLGGLGPPTPTSAQFNLYVRDIGTDAISLVSVNAAGTDGGNGQTSSAPGMYSFSPDGTKVAFTTLANNLGPTDSNRTAVGDSNDDVYLRDLVAGTTTLVSANAAGTDSGNSRSVGPVFNPDGTSIAFASSANNLGPTDSSRGAGPTTNQDVYVRDLSLQTTSLVSANASNSDSGNGRSGAGAALDLSFDPDGDRLAFTSSASNLTADDADTSSDVFVRDLASASTTLVSTNAAGTGSANGFSTGPRFSPAGGMIAFVSTGSDLGPRDTNTCALPAQCADVYLRDLANGTTSLVSTTFDGRDGSGGLSTNPVFQPNGTKIAFTSNATTFGPADNNGGIDIYLAAIRNADISVSVSAEPEPVATGEDVTYTVQVSNGGPDRADDVAGTFVLPEGTTFVNATTTLGTCTPPTAEQPRVPVCTVGDLGSGADAEIVVTASVSAPAGSTLTAVAVGGTTSPDPNGDNNAAAVDSSVVAAAGG